jgi:hypothetical protein
MASGTSGTKYTLFLFCFYVYVSLSCLSSKATCTMMVELVVSFMSQASKKCCVREGVNLAPLKSLPLNPYGDS